MSKNISSNESSKKIKVVSAAVPQVDVCHYKNSENKGSSAAGLKKPNDRKNTVTSTTTAGPSSSGSSIMEDEDATTTTVAIGNNTYTIGEPRSDIMLELCRLHFLLGLTFLAATQLKNGYCIMLA